MNVPYHLGIVYNFSLCSLSAFKRGLQLGDPTVHGCHRPQYNIPRGGGWAVNKATKRNGKHESFCVSYYLFCILEHLCERVNVGVTLDSKSIGNVAALLHNPVIFCSSSKAFRIPPTPRASSYIGAQRGTSVQREDFGFSGYRGFWVTMRYAATASIKTSYTRRNRRKNWVDLYFYVTLSIKKCR